MDGLSKLIYFVILFVSARFCYVQAESNISGLSDFLIVVLWFLMIVLASFFVEYALEIIRDNTKEALLITIVTFTVTFFITKITIYKFEIFNITSLLTLSFISFVYVIVFIVLGKLRTY